MAIVQDRRESPGPLTAPSANMCSSRRVKGTILGTGRSYARGMPGRPAIVRYRVIIEHDEGGVFVAKAPSLPRCVSQGRTREEAMVNIRDAIAAYLASLHEHREPIPPGTEEEFVEIP